MDHEEYLRRVRSYIKTPTKEIEEQLDGFCQLCTYISGQYDKDDSFINLTKHLEDVEKGHKEQNRVFYMALPPSVFITVSDQLKRNCYPKNGIARIIVSRQHKSFVSTEAYAYACFLCVYRSRSPSARISRVLVTSRRPLSPTGRRRRSSVLTTTWVRRWSRTFSSCASETSSSTLPGTVTTLITCRYELNVFRTTGADAKLLSQITFKEPFGTEGRGGYFDEFGIIRDVMQNRMSNKKMTLTANDGKC